MNATDARRTILHLPFDEGKGAMAHDASGHLPDAVIQYRHLNPRFTGHKEPQWRVGSLLFDGSSTAVVYPEDAVCLQGSALTISAWIAPRAFEWDEPYAAERGEPHLTAVAGQYDRDARRGALLGFHRFGRLCFQAGTGDKWLTLWADAARLRRLSWNHVAAVFDGAAGMMRLYQDGALAGETEIPVGSRIAPAAGERLMVGRNAHAESIPHGVFNMFAGLMRDLRVEAAALTAEEIRARASEVMPDIDYADIGLENILTDDCQKTQYHGGPYQHWMNEPHAPVYYNGRYHLFFQSNSFGPYWRGISWGHLVSGDTVRWRPVRDAIVPTERGVAPDGVWSGGATLDKNGVPVLFFAAGNHRFAEAGLISNQNIGAAYPADLTDPDLADWVVLRELAIPQRPGEGRPGEFRDAHVWREGGVWYMVVCSGSARTDGGTALLYSTDVLEVRPGVGIDMAWRYRGPVYEMPDQPAIYGTSWELPVLLPVRDRAGAMTRHVFFFLPAPVETADNKIYYFVGDFDGEAGRFTPDPSFGDRPRLLDYGDNVFTGPSAFIDPATGRLCLFSVMQDQRDGAEEGAAGWAHCAGLTRNVWLSGDGRDICVEPDPRLYGLLGERLLSLNDADVAGANRALAGVSGDMLYIRGALIPQGGASFGLTVKAGGAADGTGFVYDLAAGTICGFTRNPGSFARNQRVKGPLPLRDGALNMEVFVDRSLVEAFFNGDRAVSVRAYADRSSQGVFLTADGGLRVSGLEVFRVKSIYEENL